MKRLNDDETVLLITFVQNRECLWNENNSDYKRISITRKLWNEIGSQLNISGDEAKTKWKNLKDKFKKVFRSYQEENSDPLSVPQWRFYSTLLFLKDVILPDQQATGISNSSNIIITSNSTSTVTENGEGADHDNPEGEFQEYDVDFLVRKTPDRESSSRSRGCAPLGTKRKTSDQSEEIRQPEEIQVSRVPALARSTEKKDDDDYYFLISLLPYIKTLSPVEKLELRSRMQNLVTDSYKKNEMNKRQRVNH